MSKIEQVAAFLRAELAGGRWEGAMPGRVKLAAELGLYERTVEEALRLLEWEGACWFRRERGGGGSSRRRESR